MLDLCGRRRRRSESTVPNLRLFVETAWCCGFFCKSAAYQPCGFEVTPVLPQAKVIAAQRLRPRDILVDGAWRQNTQARPCCRGLLLGEVCVVGCISWPNMAQRRRHGQEEFAYTVVYAWVVSKALRYSESRPYKGHTNTSGAVDCAPRECCLLTWCAGVNLQWFILRGCV